MQWQFRVVYQLVLRSTVPPILISSLWLMVIACRYITGEERLTTAYFRYTGERRPHAYALTHGTTTTSTGIDAGNPTTTSTRSAQEVERLLNEISPALKVPLQLLREQYHKLGNKD